MIQQTKAPRDGLVMNNVRTWEGGALVDHKRVQDGAHGGGQNRRGRKAVITARTPW